MLARRIPTPLLVVAFVAAACGGGASTPTDEPVSTPAARVGSGGTPAAARPPLGGTALPTGERAAAVSDGTSPSIVVPPPTSATAEPAGVGPGQEVELPYRERRVVAGALRMTFSGHRDDRCPSDVVCEWPGNAVVHLLVAGLSGSDAGIVREVRLDTSRVAGPETATVAGYTIGLIALLPERPGPGVTADDYAALLLVDGPDSAAPSATAPPATVAPTPARVLPAPTSEADIGAVERERGWLLFRNRW